MPYTVHSCCDTPSATSLYLQHDYAFCRLDLTSGPAVLLTHLPSLKCRFSVHDSSHHSLAMDLHVSCSQLPSFDEEPTSPWTVSLADLSALSLAQVLICDLVFRWDVLVAGSHIVNLHPSLSIAGGVLPIWHWPRMTTICGERDALQLLS